MYGMVNRPMKLVTVHPRMKNIGGGALYARTH
jgi:hypothetical protein